jgi:putative RecB family exonuclease
VPPPPSLEKLLQFYDQNWKSAGYQSAEEEANYKEYGKTILTRFWEIHTADFRMPIAVERQFYIDIEGVKLRGIIDRVDKLESGGLAIVDYKTTQELFTNEALRDNLQLTLYQIAAEQTWQLPVEKLTLYHLRSNTPCSCSPRGEKEVKEAKRLVVEIAEQIASQHFPAKEGPFCPCDFPEHCPYYRHKYDPALTAPAQKEILCGTAVEDAVEQYVSLQQQIKTLQMELEELKEKIVALCQEEELNRVYGREHALTYKLVETVGFDEEEVRAVLEPLGLWDRVLSFDQGKLKQLLADDGLAKEIRDKLEALRRVTSCSPRLWVRKLREEE